MCVCVCEKRMIQEDRSKMEREIQKKAMTERRGKRRNACIQEEWDANCIAIEWIQRSRQAKKKFD